MEKMVLWTDSKEMVADLLTKPLPKVQFQKLRELMGVHELEAGSED